MAPPTQLPGATRIGRVALRVTDLDAATSFYADVVGLHVVDRAAGRATLGAGETPLLELHGDPDAPERGPAETGLFHLAVRVPDRAALGDALERVRSEWRLDGASDHLVSEALYLSDPEDNGVEIYCDRPRPEWPTGEDTVEMDTLPLDLDAVADRATGAGHVPDDADVGHVHLEVSSLPAAERFYVDALGLRVRQRYGDAATFLAAGDYHHHVGLNTWNGRTDPPAGRGLEWFEFLVPGEAFDDAVARLRSGGATVDDRPGGAGAVQVTDPDGIRVRLRQP